MFLVCQHTVLVINMEETEVKTDFVFIIIQLHPTYLNGLFLSWFLLKNCEKKTPEETEEPTEEPDVFVE